MEQNNQTAPNIERKSLRPASRFAWKFYYFGNQEKRKMKETKNHKGQVMLPRMYVTGNLTRPVAAVMHAGDV